MNFSRSTLIFKIQQNSQRKKIVQQILRDRYKGEASIFKTMVALIVKKIVSIVFKKLLSKNCSSLMVQCKLGLIIKYHASDYQIMKFV